VRVRFVLWELCGLAGSHCLSRRGNSDALAQEFRLRAHTGSMPFPADTCMVRNDWCWECRDFRELAKAVRETLTKPPSDTERSACMSLSICSKRDRAVAIVFPAAGEVHCVSLRCFMKSQFVHIKRDTSWLIFHGRMRFKQCYRRCIPTF